MCVREDTARVAPSPAMEVARPGGGVAQPILIVYAQSMFRNERTNERGEVSNAIKRVYVPAVEGVM